MLPKYDVQNGPSVKMNILLCLCQLVRFEMILLTIYICEMKRQEPAHTQTCLIDVEHL